MNSILLHRKSKNCSIPALRDESGTWILDAQSKANLFADVWSSKFSLPASVDDSWVISASTNSYLQHVNIRSRHALKILKTLDISKATGPDGIPARVLRNVASEIAWVVKVIARRILAEGHWPERWRHHHLVPIFKRSIVHQANNYRGVHITSTLSKVMERIIGHPLLHFFHQNVSYGLHQWAYCKKRNNKDLITLLMCSWLYAISEGRCIGAYLTDISGEFDRIFTPYFLK